MCAVGIGALRLLHQDVGDVLDNLREALHFSPESRLVNFILDKASLIDDPMLRRIGAVAFSYAALSFAEGIGLYLEKAWGEFLTLIITASFLPWEIFEVFHRLTWVRVGLLVINTMVLLYLLKLVASRKKLAEEPTRVRRRRQVGLDAAGCGAHVFRRGMDGSATTHPHPN